MRCKKCGTDNPDSASYCRNCGFELSAIRRNRASSDEYDADKIASFDETLGMSGPGETASLKRTGESADNRGRYSAGGLKNSVDNRRDSDRENRDGYYRGGRDAFERGNPGRGAYGEGGSSYVDQPSTRVPAGYSAEPLSMWAYMGLSILFGLPLAGFICLIVFSCGAVKNINLVNFARGLLLIEIIVMVLGFLLMYIYGLSIVNLFNGLASSY